jgi:hypothetical protein
MGDLAQPRWRRTVTKIIEVTVIVSKISEVSKVSRGGAHRGAGGGGATAQRTPSGSEKGHHGSGSSSGLQSN